MPKPKAAAMVGTVFTNVNPNATMMQVLAHRRAPAGHPRRARRRTTSASDTTMSGSRNSPARSDSLPVAQPGPRPLSHQSLSTNMTRANVGATPRRMSPATDGEFWLRSYDALISTPPLKGESCSSSVWSLPFLGMSNTTIAVTELPGLISFKKVFGSSLA